MNVQALKRTSATSKRFVQTQKDPMSVAALKDIKARDETVQVIYEIQWSLYDLVVMKSSNV